MTNTDWKTTLDTGLENIGSFGKTAPATLAGYKALHAAGAQTARLDPKIRELICIAVAVTTRSEVCIVNHVAKARDLGATREEVAEALGVAVAMNAGAAIAYSGHAIDAYAALSGEAGETPKIDPNVCG
jgi:AhpD family alkylhydroperoxidase